MEAIVYIYDASGAPIGFKYRASTYATDAWDVYWYEKNLQGDIVSVYDASGNLQVHYVYNAWGRTTKELYCDEYSGAARNNLTYRGYYYDPDLKMYYLQSRYYDSKTCRFINADGYVSTGQGLTGYNMFAYCNNNPVMRVDYSGEFPWLIAVFVLACTIGGALVGNAVANKIEDDRNMENSLNKETNGENIAVTPSDTYVMSKSERTKYIVVGALLGTAVGGTVVSALGVVGTLATGSAMTKIGVLGMTGLQTYALGSLIRNVAFYIITPFIDIGEANEEFFEIPETYEFNNPYIP